MFSGTVIGSIAFLCYALIFKPERTGDPIGGAIVVGSFVGTFFGSILGSTPAENRRAVFIDIIGSSVSMMFFRWLQNSIWVIDSANPPHLAVRFIRWIIPVILGLLVYYALRPQGRLKR